MTSELTDPESYPQENYKMINNEKNTEDSG